MQVTHEQLEEGPSSEPVALEPLHTSVPSPLKKSTGPRTVAGKKNSKRNALKHGILSSVALLPHESASDFDSLLNGLRNDLQPEGTLENVLVEKLAVFAWRLRRAVAAETAEIQKQAAFLQWDENERREKEAEETIHRHGFRDWPNPPGLLRTRGNPRVLDKCIELLRKLKGYVERGGFDAEFDEQLLTRVYGNCDFFDRYRFWCSAAKASTSEDRPDGDPSPEECTREFLKELQKEITRLEQYKKASNRISTERVETEVRRQNVPDSPNAERLLRYETTIERNFDRTLNQLERLQRMRMGQPVPPPVNVNLSSS